MFDDDSKASSKNRLGDFPVEGRFGGNLQAPCGSDYLHVVRVKVNMGESSARNNEGKEWVIKGESCSVDHYVQLVMDCELCGELHVLGIEQHKGETQVSWLRNSKPFIRQ